MDPLATGLARTLLRLAQTARYLLERHAHRHFLAGNEVFHFPPPLLGADRNFQIVLGQTRHVKRLDPGRHAALLGIATHTQQTIRGNGVELHSLRKTQGAGKALHRGLEETRGRAGQLVAWQALVEVG